MWTCPTCNRSFRNSNQMHTCKLVSVTSLFERRSANLRALYNQLKTELDQLGSYREEAVKPDVIFIKTKSTFLTVKVKSKWLDVQFFLAVLEDVPPVKKYRQASTHRVEHVVSIDEIEDIDPQLINWIKRSYHLISTA